MLYRLFSICSRSGSRSRSQASCLSHQPCLASAMAWASSSARCDPIMKFLPSVSSRSAPRHGFAGGDQKRAGDFEQQRDGFQNFADDGNERDQSGRDGGVEEVEGGDGDLGEAQLLEEAAEAEAIPD